MISTLAGVELSVCIELSVGDLSLSFGNRGAFQISQDLQTLTWRECEGNGSSKRLPLSSIGSIKEINIPRNGSGLEHGDPPPATHWGP